jgi:hypothetical protein
MRLATSLLALALALALSHAAPAELLVRIAAVDPAQRTVWLANFGEGARNTSAFGLCVSGECAAVGALPVVAGSVLLRVVPQRSFAVLRFNTSAFAAAAGSVALFANASGNLSDAANLLDFVRWGPGDATPAEALAVSKGLWPANATVSAALTQPLTFVGRNDSTGPSAWAGNVARMFVALDEPPVTVIFADTNVGVASHASADLFYSVGTAPLQVLNVSFVGAGAAQFRLLPFDMQTPIAPRLSRVFYYVFHPSASGTFDATLEIYTNAAGVGENPYRIAVRGTAAAVPRVRVLSVRRRSPPSITLRNFGGAPRNLGGLSLCVNGTAPLNCTSLALFSGGASDLAAGATATLFVPDTLSALAASLASPALSLGLYVGTEPADFDSEDILSFLAWGAWNETSTDNNFAYASSVRLWALGAQTLEALPVLDFVGNGSLAVADPAAQWVAGPSVRIVGVAPQLDSVALFNFGRAAANITAWKLCVRRRCLALQTLRAVDSRSPNGSDVPTVMAPRTRLVLRWDESLAPGADVALFDTALPQDQLLNVNLADYVQFGGEFANSTGYLDFAVSASLWGYGASLPLPPAQSGQPEGALLSFRDDSGLSAGLAQWGYDPLVRLFFVAPRNATLGLRFWGHASLDVSGYYLASRASAAPVSSFQLVSGNTTLSPHATLLVLRAPAGFVLDAAADQLALFADASLASPALADYVAYGAAAASGGRSALAVDAGLWPSDEALAGSGAAYLWLGANPLEYSPAPWGALGASSAAALRVSAALLAGLAALALAVLA